MQGCPKTRRLNPVGDLKMRRHVVTEEELANAITIARLREKLKKLEDT